MDRFAGSAKPNNSCFTTARITARCASPRESIRKIFETGCKKFAHAAMQRQRHAPHEISLSAAYKNRVQTTQEICDRLTNRDAIPRAIQG
jgi:hypothetical protein